MSEACIVQFCGQLGVREDARGERLAEHVAVHAVLGDGAHERRVAVDLAQRNRCALVVLSGITAS